MCGRTEKGLLDAALAILRTTGDHGFRIKVTLSNGNDTFAQDIASLGMIENLLQTQRMKIKSIDICDRKTLRPHLCKHHPTYQRKADSHPLLFSAVTNTHP